MWSGFILLKIVAAALPRCLASAWSDGKEGHIQPLEAI